MELLITILQRQELLGPREFLLLASLNKNNFQFLEPQISKQHLFKVGPFKMYKPINACVNELDEISKMDSLPPHITRLRVDTQDLFSVTKPSHVGMQKAIASSPNLIHLVYNSPCLFPINTEYPSNLKSLRTSSVSPQKFPPSLSELHLTVQDKRKSKFTNPHIPSNFPLIESLVNLPLTHLHLEGPYIPIKQFPTQLQSLSLHGSFRGNLTEILKTLPLLTKFTLNEDFMVKAIDDGPLLTYLPSTLTHLNIPLNALDPNKPPTLPPKLTSLVVRGGVALPASLISLVSTNLPPLLTNLELRVLSLTQISSLPPKLTSLVIESDWFNQEIILPPTLKTLKMLVPVFNHPIILPKGLSKFKFYARAYTLPLPAFPTSTKSLNFSLHEFNHPIGKLPPNLNKLALFLSKSYSHILPSANDKIVLNHNPPEKQYCWCDHNRKWTDRLEAEFNKFLI